MSRTNNTTTKHILDEVYLACRRENMPAHEALDRAHYVKRIKDALASWDQGDSIHWERPMAEVWFKETPEGRYEVAYDLDQDVDKDAVDDYPADFQLAYQGQQWAFWTVSVVFIGKDGRIGEAYMGSIDAGEAFTTQAYPLDEPQQVYAVAIDYYKLDEQARQDARESEPTVAHNPKEEAVAHHPSWDEDESLEYDPMNALGVAGFRWYYHDDECQHVFGRGEGDDERHMLGEAIPGGVNLMLGGSFYNPIMVAEHATIESFVAAFTAKWQELVSEHYDEDES